MITVVIPTENDEAALARMLPQLVHDLVHGPITDVIVFDRGSSDATNVVCDVAGCGFFEGSKHSLASVFAQARGAWLLFLPPGAVLSAGWSAHVSEYIDANNGQVGPAVFKVATDPGKTWWQRVFEGPKKQHPVLPRGYLISRRQAQSSLRTDATIADIVRGRAAKKLRAEIYVPAYKSAMPIN